MQIALSVSPSFTPILSHSLTCTLSFYLSLCRSLCSLMFYLISHNKASLWTAINCVWIFSSEEKQRAVWKGSSPAGCLHIDAEEYCHPHCWINHSRHCCFIAGATSQKEAWQHHRRGLQNDTALIVEEGGRGGGEMQEDFGGNRGWI